MRLKVKIGDKIQDSSDRNRYGTIEKAIRSSGQATVKWNLPPGWQPEPARTDANADADADAAELRKETQARAAEAEADVASDKLDHEPTGHGY